MPKRLTMNSETLQKNFPSTYRDFFASSQRVASASNSFLWMGEFAGFYGGLTVSQKLPIRSYVGFETTFDGKVTIDRSYVTFDPSRQKFITDTTDDRLVDNLKKYLTGHVKDNKKFTGVKVHLLAELPLGRSLGSNGAIAAALARLLIDSDDIDTLFKTAREILSLNQAGHSSGVTAYMALTDETSPVVFFTKGDTYYAKSLDQLVEIKDKPIWPIDFGLIYSGTKTNAESVILANQETIKELNHGNKQLRELLGQNQSINFQDTYVNMLNMTTGLFITSLVGLFTKGAANQRLESLFNSLNQYQNLLHILHISNRVTDLIYSRIHQLANKETNEVGSGAKISGIGKGGAVLFALPYGNHRGAIEELVDGLKQETKQEISLDYASWLDGIGGEAARIEQDIAKGNYSSFVTRDTLILTVLEKGKVRKEVVTSEHFSEFKQKIDLLLDKTTGKISIAGTSVTSKELPSQKATVAILSDLIKAKGFRLSNAKLPASYGESRYDLQGKIVLPLAKQIKIRTRRDLQLTIRGGMYEDYELSLNPSNIIISTLEEKT